MEEANMRDHSSHIELAREEAEEEELKQEMLARKKAKAAKK